MKQKKTLVEILSNINKKYSKYRTQTIIVLLQFISINIIVLFLPSRESFEVFFFKY